MGKMENLTPVKLKQLNRLTHNLSGLIMSTRGVFVPNLVKNTFTGDFWAKGWNTTFCDFIFFSDQRREETPGRILMLNGSKDAKSRKDVPFGGYKIKNWNLTHFTPKTLKIWPWIGNFQPKWWNMKLQVYQKVLNQLRWKFNTMLGT